MTADSSTVAQENDDKEFTLTRRELLRFLPDATVLNRFEQAVINRAVRATVEIRDVEGMSV